MRRRAIVGAFLLVGLGVVLGTTAFRTSIAHATGFGPAGNNAQKVVEQNLDGNNIRVHEEGTATVQQAGTPWTKVLSSSNNTSTNFTVPSGQRLVIQYVSGYYTPGASFSPIGILTPQSSAGNAMDFDFVGTLLLNSISRYEFSQQVTIYADPSSTVKWNFPGSGSGVIFLTGYLLPA